MVELLVLVLLLIVHTFSTLSLLIACAGILVVLVASSS